MVVRAHELVQHRASTAGGARCRRHAGAADVREGLEVGGLAARRGSHRLVESSETPAHVAERHFGEAQLRERPQVQIRVMRGERDIERARRKLRRSRSISRALERASSSQPRSEPGATSRSMRAARASQPRAAASLSNASPYSQASQSATRVARANSIVINHLGETMDKVIADFSSAGEDSVSGTTNPLGDADLDEG